MIQGVIYRMAKRSFQLNGSVTLAVALEVFLKSEASPAYLFVRALPVVAFWLLDAWYLKGERFFRHLLDDVRKKNGPADFSIDLAALLQATNRLGEAEPLMKRALAIDEKSYGPEHPTVASDLNNLAQLLKDTNRLGEAEPLMKRALAIDEKSYGPEHPNVARASTTSRYY